MKYNKLIDHTLLKQDASPEQIANLCQEAIDHDFMSVCVNPCYVKLAKDYLKNTYICSSDNYYVDNPFEREVEIPISYKGEPLGANYKADFVCYGNIIVELKAVTEITSMHKAQILNYIKATGFSRGVLINFGEDNLKGRIRKQKDLK